MSDDSILTALARLESRLVRLEDGQTALRVDVMARMDRLENKLTEIRDDIAVNFGATDTVKRANDNTREELRSLGETVSAMYRVVRRLDDRVRHLEGDAPAAHAG